MDKDTIAIRGDTLEAPVAFLHDLLDSSRRTTAARRFLDLVDKMTYEGTLPGSAELGEMLQNDPEFAHLSGEAHADAWMEKYGAAYHFRRLEQEMREFLTEAENDRKSREGLASLYPFVGLVVVWLGLVAIAGRLLVWAFELVAPIH